MAVMSSLPQAKCSRQIRNAQLASMGCESLSTYQTPIEADHVRMELVEPDPFVHEKFEARVWRVYDHGYYRTLEYERLDNGEHGRARIFSDGPPEWGIIALVVTRRVRPTGSHADSIEERMSQAEVLKDHRRALREEQPWRPASTYDMSEREVSLPRVLLMLPEPEPCPNCHAMCVAIPRQGWPCLACRSVDEGEVE